MAFPLYPEGGNPYFGDEKTHGDELGRVSPEGNAYGAERLIREWKHAKWWTGTQYEDVVVAGRADTFQELPSGRPFGEIWQVRDSDGKGNLVWTEFWYDSTVQKWKLLRWLWEIDELSGLPQPGKFIGAGHVVNEAMVTMKWDGFQWIRWPAHSRLLDDEPERHLPPGFLQMLAPDARVIFVNPDEIGLERAPGGMGTVNVSGEWITASRSCSVFSRLQSVEWDAANTALVQHALQPNVEYQIYLANNQSPEFWLSGWDYRGKLFLSLTADVDGYMASEGPGKNARLVGRVTTSADEPPQFIRTMGLSLISRTTNFPETYRDYSDYRIEFVDQDTLSMSLLDGRYGQIFIAGELYYLGGNYLIPRAAHRVIWTGTLDARLGIDESAIQSDATYFLYIGGDIDGLNFNSVNPATSRPWQPGDEGALENYHSDMDLRLKPFLSMKAPEHGVLSQEWPGYEIRHIGQVQVDGTARFTNAADISSIQQPTLNPTYFDGLAECSISTWDETEFRIIRKGGTSGIVMVGGNGVQTYEKLDLHVHRVRNTDFVQDYDETNLDTPLSPLNRVFAYPNTNLYVYLANYRSHWGEFTGRTFVSTIAPIQGKLSRNWPGNTARWLATIKPAADGRFTGSFVQHSLSADAVKINDAQVSLGETWSSARIQGALNSILITINAAQGYEAQKTLGLPIQLEFQDTTHLFVRSISDANTIVFPDLTTLSVSPEGICCTVTGTPGVMYYVYLTSSGVLHQSTVPPDAVFTKLQIKGNDILVGYSSVASSNLMAGPQNVYSYWHEPERQFSVPVPDLPLSAPYVTPGGLDFMWDLVGSIPGLLIPAGVSASVQRTGATTFWFQGLYAYWSNYYGPFSFGVGHQYVYFNTAYIWDLTISLPTPSLSNGVYANPMLLLRIGGAVETGFNRFEFTAHTGEIVITRPGN